MTAGAGRHALASRARKEVQEKGDQAGFHGVHARINWIDCQASARVSDLDVLAPGQRPQLCEKLYDAVSHALVVLQLRKPRPCLS